MRTVVLDTNVLLADPEVLFAYPDAEVIIPETVLSEIDKLKTTRVDPDLRFKGREVSRILFDFSESGSLIDGIELPDGGRLRVIPFETDTQLPDGLSARNPDDRILAVAHQVCAAGCESLTLVTNDLNMLLKAQTYGLKVERRDEAGAGFAKRTVRWFQRYKVPLTILAIAVAVFAGVLALSLYTTRVAGNGSSTIPPEFRDALGVEERNLLDGLIALQADPEDAESMKQVADAYSVLSEDRGVLHAQKAVEYYTKYLALRPDDGDARTDMAVLYFNLGRSDDAIREVSTVLSDNPEHLEANFNLGIFYWQSRKDYQNGANQLMKAADIADRSADPHLQAIGDTARQALEQIRKEAEAAGVKVDIDPKYLPGGTT